MEIRCRRRKFTPKPAVMQEQTGDGMGSQGNVLGGTMIIAGTAIGAGMLALPMISAGMWIYWSLLLMVLTWMLMLRASQAILEVNLHYEPGSSFHTLVQDTLGPVWSTINGLAVAFVLYILVYAYVSGGGSTVQQTVMAVTGNDPGMMGSSLFFSLILMACVWWSTRFVDRLSVILMGGMVLTFILSMTGMLSQIRFSDSIYQIDISPAKNENGQFFDMLMAEELDSKNLDNAGIDGQISFGEDAFYQKYEQKIKLLTDKFMPPKDEDEHLRAQKRKEMEQYADYRNYLSFSMFEQVTDEHGNVIRENFVDDMAGRDSGGEGQNPKYVALLAGFAMLYMQQSKRDSKIKLVLLDEAFSKMDQERSAVCLKYARKMDLQLIVCVPDERLQSLIRNVDCVYGFRRFKNRISMMHIDKGQYLEMMEG
jgi:hypothetical protein